MNTSTHSRYIIDVFNCAGQHHASHHASDFASLLQVLHSIFEYYHTWTRVGEIARENRFVPDAPVYSAKQIIIRDSTRDATALDAADLFYIDS